MLRTKLGSLAAVASCLFLYAPGTAAHGHDMNKVQDGEAMSLEPIVRLCRCDQALNLSFWTLLMEISIGFDVMDTHPTPDTGIRDYLPCRNGSWGKHFSSPSLNHRQNTDCHSPLQIVRNRWHVPTQIFGTVIAVVGYFLGHLHKGRVFAKNIHATFANSLMLMLIVQIVFGIYLRFHITKGFHGKIRKVAVYGHGIVGKVMPVVSWTQMLFGGITALGFCRDDHLGQCLAHFIMGSAFIGYGILLTIVMLAGQAWLRKTGRSQEFFDSAMIAAWGCVNTFTEHSWGGPWVANDIQHTTMGVIWWSAGLAGVWLSRKRDGSPKRNFIPGFVIFITGWAMSAHPQHLPLSNMVHTAFGYSLMAAGLTRIVEIAFVLRDRATLDEGGDANSFQYIPPFVCFPPFLGKQS